MDTQYQDPETHDFKYGLMWGTLLKERSVCFYIHNDVDKHSQFERESNPIAQCVSGKSRIPTENKYCITLPKVIAIPDFVSSGL
jgi:hypothetical protein